MVANVVVFVVDWYFECDSGGGGSGEGERDR